MDQNTIRNDKYEVKQLAGLKLLVRPLVRMQDIVQGFQENDQKYELQSSFEQAFSKTQNKYSLLTIDGGGIKGIVPVQSLLQAERIIKQYLLSCYTQTKQKCVLISQSKLEEIKIFRQQRTAQTNAATEDITYEDFDVVMCDFFEATAGTSTGSIIAAFVATMGVEGSLDKLLETIIQNGLQKLVPHIRLEKSTPKKNIKDDLKEGLQNSQYDGICPQQGTVRGLAYLYYYFPPLIFTPNSQPNAFFFGSQAQKLTPSIGSFFKSVESTLQLPDVFSKDRSYMSRYSADGLQVILNICFGERMLSDTNFFKTSLYIPSFDIQHRRPMSFFKLLKPQSLSFDHGLVTTAQIYDKDQFLVKRSFDTQLSNIVRASAAAPMYFPSVELKLPVGFNEVDEDIILVDGGVVSNNPTMQCLAYIQGDQQRELRDFTIMSLGCGYSENLALSSNLSNIKYIVDILMNVAMQSDTYVAPWYDLQNQQVLKDAYLRIQRVSTSEYKTEQDPIEKTLTIGLDDITKVDDLVQAGQVIAKAYEQKMIVLLEKYVIPRAIYRGLNSKNGVQPGEQDPSGFVADSQNQDPQYHYNV